MVQQCNKVKYNNFQLQTWANKVEYSFCTVSSMYGTNLCEHFGVK